MLITSHICQGSQMPFQGGEGYNSALRSAQNAKWWQLSQFTYMRIVSSSPISLFGNTGKSVSK